MIFLKYCILPNLNEADTDQRKVKFQKRFLLSEQTCTDPDYVRYLLIILHYAGGIWHPEDIKQTYIK